MTQVDKDAVRELATLVRLRLSEAQAERAGGQMQRLLDYFERLQAVDTDGLEPSPYPRPIPHRLRADRAEAALPRDDVLANAPQQRAGAFLVPRVVDG